MILHVIYFGLGMVMGVFVCLLTLTIIIEFQVKKNPN
jgi:hypothetical protein